MPDFRDFFTLFFTKMLWKGLHFFMKNSIIQITSGEKRLKVGKTPYNEKGRWEIVLIGEYQYSIDTKGRVNFPAKLREDLGDRFIIVKGLGDDCLFVYSMERWKSVEEQIGALPFSKARNLQRFFFSSACEVEADKQGRVVIPANLREYAGLEKDVTIIGASSHCEIWSKERWNDCCMAQDSYTIAGAMDELGF